MSTDNRSLTVLPDLPPADRDKLATKGINDLSQLAGQRPAILPLLAKELALSEETLRSYVAAARSALPADRLRELDRHSNPDDWPLGGAIHPDNDDPESGSRT